MVNGFVMQGGDPEGTGMGGSANTIRGEFAENGVQNCVSNPSIEFTRLKESAATGLGRIMSASTAASASSFVITRCYRKIFNQLRWLKRRR